MTSNTTVDRMFPSFDAIVEPMTEAVLVLDRTGMVVAVNESMMSLLGLPDRNSALRPISEYAQFILDWRVGDDPFAPDDLRRSLEGESIRRQRASITTTAGLERTIEFSTTPIRDGADVVQFAMLVAQDLTESERTQAYWQAVGTAAQGLTSELDVDVVLTSVFDMIIASSGGHVALGLWRLDETRDRLHLQIYRGISEATAEMLRELPADGESFICDAVQMREPQYLEDAQETRTKSDIDRRLVAEEGLSSWVASPLLAGVNVIGVMGYGLRAPQRIYKQDLEAVRTIGRLFAVAIEAYRERDRLAAQHAQDQLRAQLNQSRRLESLGRLAGGVAHDFNNLLGVMLGYSSFVSESLAEVRESGLPPDRIPPMMSDVDQIAAAAQRAAGLTRQLLAFSRREVIKPEVLDLNTVVLDVESLLRRTIGAQVQLVTSLSPDLHPIKADKGQLEQVLMNLAVNARDAMPGGGNLTIDTANLEVDLEDALLHPGLEPGPHVRLRVSDTGAGMTQEVIDRAFEPFFTTKPTGEGTGLGLPTVYGIITQWRGSVRLDSEPGLGTTVTILIPAAGARTTIVAPPQPQPPRLPRAETVLLVEEEDALREVTERILTRSGYHVLVAGGGAEAVEIARRHAGTIDLLLTDVVMPGMGGRDVADHVSMLRPEIRVLFMSGYAEQVMLPQGTLSHEASVVPKPFTPAMLLEKLDEVLGPRAID